MYLDANVGHQAEKVRWIRRAQQISGEIDELGLDHTVLINAKPLWL